MPAQVVRAQHAIARATDDQVPLQSRVQLLGQHDIHRLAAEVFSVEHPAHDAQLRAQRRRVVDAQFVEPRQGLDGFARVIVVGFDDRQDAIGIGALAVDSQVVQQQQRLVAAQQGDLAMVVDELKSIVDGRQFHGRPIAQAGKERGRLIERFPAERALAGGKRCQFAHIGALERLQFVEQGFELAQGARADLADGRQALGNSEGGFFIKHETL